MEINQVAAHIAQSDIRSVLNLTNATGSAKGVIRAGGNNYNISIGEDGNVSVSFRGGLFNCFRQKSLRRMQETMQEQYDKFRSTHESVVKGNVGAIGEDKYSLAMQSVRQNTFDTIGKIYGEDAGGQEIAIYGFSPVRTVGDKLDARNVNFTSVDYYNDRVGVTWGGVNVSSVTKLADDIKAGRLPIKPDKDGIVSLDKLQRWGAFLQKNAGKLDIFAKIRNYMHAAENPREFKNKTGWVGEAARKGIEAMMVSLIKKNIHGCERTICDGEHKLNDRDLKALALAFMEVASRDGKVNDATFRAIIKGSLEMQGYRAGAGLSQKFIDEMVQVSNTIVRDMFFRQTSKIGLDFFKEEGIPVMFEWSSHEGISLENSDREIKSTWWKNANESIHDHFGSSITFSEMRHVTKMKEAPDGDRFNLIKVYGLRV